MDDLSIRKVIEKVTSGQIRIPAFQRGFVWDAERVAYLMDSIYKGYPFGAVILWRTKQQLNSERRLGPFSLPDSDPGFPIDYVLDGQQRLTSIFGVFQTEIMPEEQAPWINIYYDLAASSDLQDTQFFALTEDTVDPSRHFPLGTFFDVTAYRRATAELNPQHLEQIDRVQAAFKEATLPVQMIETDDRPKVAIVFERVNRLGVELDLFQLLSAWTWSEEFDLQNEFRDFADELRPFGFEDVGDDTNLLLRCCSAIVAQDASPSALINLSGARVRRQFDSIKSGMKGAIDFVRDTLHVEQLKNLPYPTLLVPLAAYFAAELGTSVRVTDAQRKQLVRWFWRACFSRRFSADVLGNLNRDISEAIKLREVSESQLADIPTALESSFFSENRFTVSSVNTKTFVLLLAQQNPVSFVSGRAISLAPVLQNYNRAEFHHCYPRSYLRGGGRDSDDMNRLANFVFMSSQDNKILGGVAPSQYRSVMDEQAIPRILERALCPTSLFDDDYEQFIQDRSQRLVSAARVLMEGG